MMPAHGGEVYPTDRQPGSLKLRLRKLARWPSLVCAFFLLVLVMFQPSQLSAPAASSSVLWSADHESGDTGEWWEPEPARVEGSNCGGEYNDAPATTSISTTSHSGRYGLALRVPNLNTGLSLGARAFRWCEAQDNSALYYSAWYMIPRHVTLNTGLSWWHIMEWKSAGSTNAKFMLAVANRANGAMYVRLGRGADSGSGFWDQTLEDIPVGQWFHLEVYYQKAATATGHITVWQDGVQIVDLANVKTANSGDLGWGVINYGQMTTPSDMTIYVDGAAISTTRLGPGSGLATSTSTPTGAPTPSATPTATAMPLPSCKPRPPVVVETSTGTNGSLTVQVSASTGTGAPYNRLRELQFDAATNALIDVRNTRDAAGSFVTNLTDGPATVTFTVRRQRTGAATTVPLVVVDDCGEWRTFVGGGPTAF